MPLPGGKMKSICTGRLKLPVVTVGVDGATEKEVTPVEVGVECPSRETMVPVPLPGVAGRESTGREAVPEVFSPEAVSL